MRKRLRQWLRRRSTKGLIGVGMAGVTVLVLAGGMTYALLGGFGPTSNSGGVNLQSGLVGWWKFDGNTKDSTPYADNGTGINVSPTTDRKGKAKGAYSFPGASDRVGVADTPNLAMGTSDWTISAWLKTSDATDTQVVLGKRDTGPINGYALSVVAGKARGLFASSQGGAYSLSLDSTVTVADGNWHLVSVTFARSGNMVLYVDGVSQASGSIATYSGQNIVTTKPFYIGEDPAALTSFFNGSIDDVRVYRRVLSSNEVVALYKAYDAQTNIGNGEIGLVGWWKLNGNTKDSTPYADNGVAVNGPVATTDRKGAAGAAYAFTAGSSQAITVAGVQNRVAAAGAFSMSGWVKPSNAPPGNNGFFGFRDYFHAEFYATQVNGGNTLECRYTNSAGTTATVNTTLTPNVWQLITVTFDGSNFRCYDNLTSSPTAAASGSIATGSNTFNIGSDSGSGNYATASIADVRLYTRALSLAQITTLYSSYNSQISLDSSPTSSQTVNLNSGLVGYWPFNGNAKDATPYQNNGAVTGATLTADRKGRANSAYLLANSGSFINVGNPATYANLATTGFTYSVWLMRTTTSSYTYPEIMGAQNTHIGYGLRSLSSGDNVVFEYGKSPYDGSANSNISFGSTTDLPVNTWVLFTVTYDGTVLRAYKNATYINQQTVALNPTFSGLYFSQNTQDFNGYIDDARVYKRPLSAAEVSALYNNYY